MKTKRNFALGILVGVLALFICGATYNQFRHSIAQFRAGTCTVASTLTANGDVTLGDAATDSVTIGAGPTTLTNATSAADGLVLGSDTAIYRSAANTVRVADSFYIDDALTVLDDATIGENTTDTLTVNSTLKVGGASASAITGILVGTGTIANGSSATTITLTGCSSSYYPFTSIANHTTNGVGIESALAQTNGVQVILTGDPGASNATIRILAVKP